MKSADRQEIMEIISSRRIVEVVHFTTNFGFVGCLDTKSVLPRNLLKKEERLEHILTLNAPFRTEELPNFDKSQDLISYVNLSISEISTNMFRHSQKWHMNDGLIWLILSFSPALMADDGVLFSTTNNIYPLTRHGSGSEGLNALFEASVPRRGNWVAMRGSRAPNLPTCEQAEVLYPGGLSLGYLERVYVRLGEDSDWVRSTLKEFGREDVTIVVGEQKFLGAPN